MKQKHSSTTTTSIINLDQIRCVQWRNVYEIGCFLRQSVACRMRAGSGRLVGSSGCRGFQGVERGRAVVVDANKANIRARTHEHAFFQHIFLTINSTRTVNHSKSQSTRPRTSIEHLAGNEAQWFRREFKLDVPGGEQLLVLLNERVFGFR